MPYVDWKDLSPRHQKAWARRMGKFYADSLPNYQYYITKAGKLPKRGRWFRWTKEHGQRMLQKAGLKFKHDNVRVRGDLRDFKTCTFHFAPED